MHQGYRATILSEAQALSKADNSAPATQVIHATLPSLHSYKHNEHKTIPMTCDKS